MITVITDIISPLATEFIMFGLAAIIYLLFTRTAYVPAKPKRHGKEGAALVEQLHKSPVKAKPWQKEMEETPSVYLPILHAAKSGDAHGAMGAMMDLSKDDLMVLPPKVATKVLLTLARTSHLPEDLMHKFMDLASSFDLTVFESAAAEASRWRSVPTNRQLYNLSGLASIQKSERLLTLLVRGHANDRRAMRGMIDDILAEDSGVARTRMLREALAAQCVSAGDHETAKLLRESAEEVCALPEATRQAKAISIMGKSGNLSGAIITFNNLKETGAANNLAYNCFLDACVEAKSLSRAFATFEEMKQKGLEDVVSYNTVMKAHLATGNIEAARQLLKDMRKLEGFAPNRVSYHVLLNALVQKGDTVAAWELMDDMIDNGLELNVATFTIILKAISSQHQAKDLPKILALIVRRGIEVEEVLFGTFADACIRCGNLRLLWDWFQCHATGNKAIEVSGPTYGNMAKAYGQARELNRVRKLWEHLCDRDVKLTNITVGCVVEAFVHNGKTQEAWDIVNQLWQEENKRGFVNTVSYSSIVKGFTVSKQQDKVVAVYKEMKERRISCNTITYNTMLNALARCGMMHEVPDLLQDMRSASPPVEPDIVTYSTIVKGYCMAGEIDRSFDVLSEMKKNGSLKPDEVLYNSLLDGCAKHSRLDQAMNLLEEMQEANVTPSNYTLSIVCKLLGRARRLDQAFTMVTSLAQKYGFRANIQVYTCLMQACFHNRQGQRALSLHDEVVSNHSCTPDEKFYTVMARGCLQTGLLEKAEAVVRCAYHLPGAQMQFTKGSPKGVEMSCLEDVLSELGFHSESGMALLKDLRELRNISVSEPASMSTQALRRNRPAYMRGAR